MPGSELACVGGIYVHICFAGSMRGDVRRGAREVPANSEFVKFSKVVWKVPKLLISLQRFSLKTWCLYDWVPDTSMVHRCKFNSADRSLSRSAKLCICLSEPHHASGSFSRVLQALPVMHQHLTRHWNQHLIRGGLYQPVQRYDHLHKKGISAYPATHIDQKCWQSYSSYQY